MREYFLDGNAQTAGWQPEVDRLRDVLDGLWKAFTDEGMPVEFRAGFTAQTAESLPGELERVKDTVQHSDRYVYDVAVAVAEADGSVIGTDPTGEVVWPEGVLTVPESTLDGIGPASLDEAVEQEAVPDAQDGLELLADAGALDALDEGLQVDELVEIAHGIDPDGDFAAWLEEVGPRLAEDPYYAAAFYNALGPDGIEALAAVFLAAGGVADINNGQGWDQDSLGPGGGQWIHHVADPFINGLADASTTGLLDLTVMFGPDPQTATFMAAGGMASGDAELPGGWLNDFTTENDRYAAAIMFSAEGDRYDGWTLGRVAQSILGEGHQYDDPDPFLTEADALMMRALAENPDAAYWFTVDDYGEPIDQYLEILDPTGRDFSHLHALEQGYNLENIWFETIPTGLLPEMYNLWSATATAALDPGTTYDYRTFNGDPIDGHPWRNEGLLLGDPTFLEGAEYEGWYDPTTGEHDSLYTIWTGAPGDELQPLVFYDEYRHHQFAQMIDLLPVFGQSKALYETITAQDPITGDDANRWISGISFVVGGALWTTSAAMGGSAFVNALRTSLRTNPPRTYSIPPHLTATNPVADGLGPPIPGMPGTYHSTYGLPDWARNSDGIYPAPTPVDEMTPSQLRDFRGAMRQAMVTSNWTTDPESVLASLPDGHPFKGMDPYDFRRMRRRLIAAMGDTGEDSLQIAITDLVDYSNLADDAWRIAGRNDWELYALIRPFIGDVEVPGINLGHPNWNGTFPSPAGGSDTLADYSPGIQLTALIPDDVSTISRRTPLKPRAHENQVAAMIEHLQSMGIQYDPLHPPQPGSPAFQDMLDVTDTFAFAVRTDGTLVLVPKQVTYKNAAGNIRYEHANASTLVLNADDDVIAAGTVVLRYDESSGLLRGYDMQDNDPFFTTDSDDDSLAWARAAFQQYGILFPE